MLRVLLIDNEELTTAGAASCNVDWDALGVSEVFRCDNGPDAQQIMNEHEIDLVISNCGLPGMDIFDLGKWIKNFFPDTALLFVSGHIRSEYAKTASHILENLREDQNTRKPENAIQDVVSYIDSHIGEKLYRSQLAEMVFYNENYLSRRFREKVGCSISTYIMEKRMEISKKLLKQTTLSVTEIGEKVGYGNTAYFIRIFKQQTEKTPNEFRKDNKSAG